MQSHKQKGFTILELLISLSIIVLLATITVFELRSSRRTEELRTAARQVSGDLRAMQSRALSAKNLKTCTTPTADLAVCEFSTIACGANPCAESIPSAYGIRFVSSDYRYTIFADINPSSGVDYRYSDAGEVYQMQSILPLETDYVIVDQITAGGAPVASADISFMRQSGTVRMFHPGVPPASEPGLIRIRLLHTITNQTTEIEINRITGRISIL